MLLCTTSIDLPSINNIKTSLTSLNVQMMLSHLFRVLSFECLVLMHLKHNLCKHFIETIKNDPGFAETAKHCYIDECTDGLEEKSMKDDKWS